MKLLSLLLLLTLALNANHVRWLSNFDEAHKKSLKQNKHLMILLIMKDSVECKDTIVTTFMNQTYIDKINREFIPVLITKDQKQSYPIEMLYTFTYPTLFIFDEQHLFSCEPIRGDITPQRLKSYLEECK
ncbi:MAG: thioredoxin family protein [Sulfurimonas sp.]|nr:thioredoxin family protein [Sulfurimonas sp.]